MGIVYTLVPETPLGGSPVVASLLVIVGFLLGLRLCHGVRRRRHVGERVLIVGGSPMARHVIAELERRPRLRYTVVGVMDDAANLGRALKATRPDRIVVALAERRGRLPLDPLLESRARGILVEDVVETYERLTGKVALESLSPSSVIFSRDFQQSRLQVVLARALSLVVSVTGLIVLAPVLALVALLIKLDSRGPVFFIHERVGMHEKPFKLIKFRTMYPVSRPKSEWERDNCDRITRVGKWLRRFRLDELPQLVNVVRGDMNLVGPRPHPATNLVLMILAVRNVSEVSGDAIPYYSLRCSVRPGITGWAQVRYGYANSIEEEMEKIRYDFYYLKHMSFWLDLRILFETVKIVLTGGRSAGGGDRRLAARLGRAA
ncbi:MAG: polyprenyl glycosylphosphotransferase [Candidatus Rokuibacteriota bacterium]|nr:MAG: polyprenyl glycosylphosphotransferase [Candidatus Rokubacteria bacterium]